MQRAQQQQDEQQGQANAKVFSRGLTGGSDKGTQHSTDSHGALEFQMNNGSEAIMQPNAGFVKCPHRSPQACVCPHRRIVG